MGPNRGGGAKNGKGGTEIKRDRLGVPLNYGQYVNGRLKTDKNSGGKGGGKSGGKGGGKGGKKGGGGGGGAAASASAPLREGFGGFGSGGSEWGSFAPPLPPKVKGGGEKIGGQSLAWWYDCFRCASCKVDVSGTIAFAQHCAGKQHFAITGFKGFSGLEPNKAGITPDLTDKLMQMIERHAAGLPEPTPAPGQGRSSKIGGKQAAKDEEGPKLQSVGSLSSASEQAIRNALHRNKSDEALYSEEAAAAPSSGGGDSGGGGAASAAYASDAAATAASDATTAASAAATARPYFCATCGVQASSSVSYQDHCKGKKHLAAVRRNPPPPSAAHTDGDGRATATGTVAEKSPGGDVVNLGNNKGSERRGRRASAGPPPLSLKPPPGLQDMGPLTAQRKALPVFGYREELLRTIAHNRVVVVEGETGSGKTTQVPHYVLEAAAAAGQPCNIVVAQPRRISAMSVAERVAAERGEKIGDTVGYTIRLESKTSSQTRMLFCTTGILLKRLEDDAELENVTHVFVDEVHERSIESDFLLMVLRDLLVKRPSLRVILMSATLDADMFHRYFGGAPSVKFPGRTFPVAELYLEHAIELTQHQVKRGADWARSGSGGGGGFGGGGKGFGGGKGNGDDGICNDFKLGRCARGAACKFLHSSSGKGGSSSSSSGGGKGGNARPQAAAAAAPNTCPECTFVNPPGVIACGICESPLLKNARGGGKGGSTNSSTISNGSLAFIDADDEELSEAELALRYPRCSSSTHAALLALDHNAIDYDLVAQVLQWLTTLGPDANLEVQEWIDGSSSSKTNKGNQGNTKNNSGCGEGGSTHGGSRNDAVLVFLPGIKEITTVQEALLQTPAFMREPQRSWVIPLHSSVPPEEQRRAFLRPPEGVRKVVLATNIAETAITVDDVAFVVDTGRMKENRYDPTRRLSSLEDCLVSRANARQRRGRAGRVQPGVAVHLFTSHRHLHVCTAAQAPEVQRVPLEQLVLRIKALQYPGTAAEVCARLIEPPAAEAVKRAVDELVSLEALTVEPTTGAEGLTALGTHLSALPVDCRVGKLMLLGAMFGCGDEALTIAATLSYRSPFLSPPQKREEADRAKHTFATGQSDHLTALRAYQECDSAGSRRFEFAREHFLGIKTLQTIAGLKRQLLELLSAAGFVQPGLRARAVEGLGRRIDGTDGVALALAGGLESNYNRGGSGGGKGTSGDWTCRACNSKANYASKSSCFRCGEPRSRSSAGAADADASSEPSVDGSPPGLGAPPGLAQTNASANGNNRISNRGNGLGSSGSGGSSPANSADFGNRDLLSERAPMLKGLLVAALFPQVVTVDDPVEKKGKKGGGGALKFRAREEGSPEPVEVALHPSCVAAKATKFDQLASKFWVFHERVKTTRVFVRDATPVSCHALLFFGGRALTADAERNASSSGNSGSNHKSKGSGNSGNEVVLRLDGWLGFKVPRRDFQMVLELRGQLEAALKRKVEQPHLPLTEGAKGLMEAVRMILDEKDKQK